MPLFWFGMAIVIGIGIAPIISIPVHLLWIFLAAIGSLGFIEIRLSRTHPNPFLSARLFAIPISFVKASDNIRLVFIAVFSEEIKKNTVMDFF